MHISKKIIFFMNIIITHTSRFNDYNLPWIYFGNSYLKMKDWENKLSGNRINLQFEIHEQARKQKIPFLKWIEEQRVANKDSIYWWMSQIAGRNNAYSNFYPYLCQLFAIKDYLQKNNQQKSVLIVCENTFLIKLLAKNFSSNFKFKFPTFLQVYWLSDLASLFMKGMLTQTKLIYFLIINFIYARLTKPKKITTPAGDAVLFHHLLDNVNCIKNSHMTCIYFTILPNWIKKKGKKVFGLPWLFKNQPTLDYYKDLRRTDYLIPEDWLNIKDYFNILKNSFKSLRNLKYEISYPDANLHYLIFYERIVQLNEQSVIFWRYAPAIQKWSKELKSLTVYDQYYNFIFEHMIRYLTKKLPIKTKSIGYYNSLTSKEFMPHQHLESEWLSQVKPDHVVCMGKVGENVLLEQGVPAKRLSSAAALRQLYLLNESGVKKNSKQILILLSLVPEICVEILSKMYSVNSIIVDELKLKVKVKIHPMMETDFILKKINWKKLPQGWEWTKKSLNSELDDSYCCVGMDTASVFDAVFNKNIVISIMSDLRIMDNYLDIFSHKYPLTSSVVEKELVDKLRDIFVSKKKLYIDEFLKLRNELIAGTNPAIPKNLDLFIKKL